MARDQRIVDAAQVGGVMHADLDHRTRYQELHPAAKNRPRGRPRQHRDIDADRCIGRITSPAPVSGIDEVEALRKRSADRKTYGFARLRHRAGEGRGGSTERQHARCRQLHKLAAHLYLPRHRQSRGGTVPLQSILAIWAHPHRSASQKVGFNVPTLGPGRAPAACHSRRAKRDNLSLPRPTSEDHQRPHS